jgi:hypothetical protein
VIFGVRQSDEERRTILCEFVVVKPLGAYNDNEILAPCIFQRTVLGAYSVVLA